MKIYWIAIPIGFLIDLALGDPVSIPHPVIFMGKLIDFLERKFEVGKYGGRAGRERADNESAERERSESESARREKLLGVLIWIIVAGASVLIPLAILLICGRISVWLRLAVESLMCWQIVATKGLRDASMKVYRALKKGDINESRQAVSMIVGRDVSSLDEKAVTRATVETIAENGSDGVIAPLLFMAIGGAPLGFFYKAVNTMDSMLGYVDPPFTNIGFFPAKMDDLMNFWPARISALLMMLAGKLLGLNTKNAWRIFRRDRYKHASPNSAQTEATIAGLLGVRLAGDAWYHGVLHKKEYIGDADREIEIEDIPLSGKILYVSAALALALSCIIAIVVRYLAG